MNKIRLWIWQLKEYAIQTALKSFRDYTLTEELRRRGHAIVSWSWEDIILYGADPNGVKIDKEAALEIIAEIDHNHDCNNGITWETLDYYISDGDFPKFDNDEEAEEYAENVYKL